MSWALYDWASSSFAAIVSTFVFPAYFARELAADPEAGTSQWGYTVGIAGLVVAITAPVLGAVADRLGRRKPLLAAFTLISVLATGALWWAAPGGEWLVPALLLAGLATVAAELAFVFYNAMLPSLTSDDRLGRWSGWGWGLGYAGGILALALALVGFVREDAWFALPRDDAEHVRATFVLVAVWYGAFALPLFLLTPDAAAGTRGIGRAVREGLDQLRQMLREMRRYAAIFRFLIARIFFIDGLAAIFTFGGIYAAGTFGLDEEGVLLFGIALNVTAGVGAAGFAWIDDWIGGKATILMSLLGLMVTGTALLVVQAVPWFWAFGMALGIFVGPVQAAGRSYMARVAPPHLRNEMFGLLAFSGKATTFVGPLLVGWVTAIFASQRAGMSVIIVFLLVGFLIMCTVPADRRAAAAAA